MLLSGKIPFNGNSYKEIVYKNTKAKINYDIFEKIDIKMCTLDLLKKMLMKNPEKRISAEQALNHEAF
jgi:calcium-dependent protein kinase